MAGSVNTLEKNKKNFELQSINLLPSSKAQDGIESSIGDNESWDSVYKPTTLSLHYESQPGCKRYVQSLKHLLPVRVKTGPGSYMPVDMTGCFAFTFFSWLTPLVWRTFRKGLSDSDLYHCSPFDSCQINGARFSTIWNKEAKKKGLKNTSLMWTLFLFMRTRYIISCLAYIVCLLCGFIGPTIFMRYLLESIQMPGSEEISIITWILGLIFSEMVRIVFFSFMWAVNIRTSIRALSAVNGLLYKKVTRLRSLSSTTSGGLVNLFSNDCRKIFTLVYNMPLVVGGPLVIAGGIIYTWWLIGPFCFIGVATFSFMYLIQFGISYLSTKFRKKVAMFSDERISLMSECLSNMKLIKLYSWEKHLIDNVRNVRLNEKNYLEKVQWLHAVSSSTAALAHVFASVLTILTYTLAGYDITPAQAFTIVMVYAVTGHGITVLPLCVKAVVNGIVAISRLEMILHLEEKENYTVVPNRLDIALSISKATLDWEQVIPHTLNLGSSLNNSSKYNKSGKEIQDEITPDTALVSTLQMETGPPPALIDISFTLERGKLVGICGSFGSGKSSLLAALLGQMRLLKGQVAVRGSIAYVPQQPWILNGSLRENVLFGQLFSSKRYYEAVYCCGLADDIAVLPGGDQTEIGERGTNISGGQKQRISLARAQYADKEIYLLDDPLSSVDGQVGRHIMQHCIKGALKDKGILLVTHDVNYLQECDCIILMRDGAIAEQGTHKELCNKESQYAAFIQMLSKDEDVTNEKEDDNIIPTTFTPHGTLKKRKSPSLSSSSEEIDENAKTLTKAEKISSGTVSCNTYTAYIQAAGGFIVCGLIIIWFAIQASSAAFSKYWLGHWLSQGDGNITFRSSSADHEKDKTEYQFPFITNNPDLGLYQLIYGITVIVMLCVALIRGYFFTKTTIRASNNLHEKLLYKVFYSPMHFFDTTPDGRILSVFTHNVDEIDSTMPSLLVSFLQKIFTVSVALLLIIIVYHWFVIPLLVLGVFFIFLQKLFRVTINDLRRYDNVTRSPIFSHVSATVQGLSVIRAFQKQDDFHERFTNLVDKNLSPLYLYYCSMRWLGTRMEILGLIITLVACLFVMFFKDSVNPAFAAMVLAIVLQLCGMYQYIVRLGCDVESKFISVERIQSYSEELECEAPSTIEKTRPSPDWPTRGKITFKDVKMRYRPGLPLALKGLTFEIEHQEKIGIVGRTGSGKSSLGAVLFRLVELSSGSIVIDGVNISEIGLDDLRSRLSIIPQQPVLFSGSLRYNLDPLNEFTDERLWQALEDVNMKQRVSSLEGGLNALVIEEGNNFSMGEKQLLCMARALLHESKIVLMDEATASIDGETDQLIQKAIQEIFVNSTVLTIAHRLSTVAYCDRVMVLSEGKIVEFDQPTILLANPNSHFSMIMASSHPPE